MIMNCWFFNWSFLNLSFFRFGSSRTTILKNMMTEYGHWIELNQNQAKAQLKRSLDRGLEIGRVRNGKIY